jgi:HAE1 family hydrophobic/amphiphilic exporter-1
VTPPGRSGDGAERHGTSARRPPSCLPRGDLLRHLPVVLILPLALTAASAQADSEEPLSLSLTQAVDLALERNPDVLRAREQVHEFNLQVREVRAEALPQLDLSMSAQTFRDPGLRNSPQFGELSEFLPPEALEPLRYDDYAYRISLEQPIYTFGRIGSALKAARAQLAAVNEDVRSMESQVAREVAVAYYDLALARERQAVLESERVARERQLEQVKDRRSLEDATRLDELTAEVALANLRPQILGAENEEAVALARLNETLARPIDAPLELLDPLTLPDPLPNVPEYSVLLAQAARTRPELLRFAHSRRFLEQGQRVRRADTLPEIKARGGIGISSYDYANLKDASFRNWSVGVYVTWKLFDGFRTSSRVGQLKSQVRQSELQEAAFRNALAREVERSSGEWERGLKAVEVAKLAVLQAHEAQGLTEDSFNWGASSVLDILEAQRAVRQAELSRAESHYVALLALADVKFLVGLRPDAPLEAALSAAEAEPQARAERQQ